MLKHSSKSFLYALPVATWCKQKYVNHAGLSVQYKVVIIFLVVYDIVHNLHGC